MVRTFFLSLVLICQFHAVPAQNIQSRHFSIEKLADGVYAAIATNGGYAICNAGIVDMGDATLIFDPFMTPEAAEDLKHVVFTLTGLPVRYVVNSHFHNDHICGNQVFDKATIISTSGTYALIKEMLPVEIDYYKNAAPERLEVLKAADKNEMTQHQLEENIMWTGYYEALVSSLDGIKQTLPSLTFEKRLILHGSRREVHLLSYGTGHTGSDLVLYLPDAQVAFMGDLLFVQNQPWLGDGDIDSWKASLDSIALLPLRQVVPGHGPVGTVNDFETMKSYMDHIDSMVEVYHESGKKPAGDASLSSPPPYDNWFLSTFYRYNVISLYEKKYGQE